MRSANDIANWFLAWAEVKDADDLSNLKLQKLLYYAQGHYLGKHGKPLFTDKLQAWAHGPVASDVYHRLKKYGSAEIDAEAEVPEDFNWDDYKDIEEHLLSVWNTYGHFSAWKLRERTHQESPWIEAFGGGYTNHEIDERSLESFFGA